MLCRVMYIILQPLLNAEHHAGRVQVECMYQRQFYASTSLLISKQGPVHP